MTTTEYDVIVIGAGAIGENVADRAAQGGLRTVIVESELVGGECSYWACMPSKTLLRSGALLREAAAVGGAREAITGPLDVAAVLKRRDDMTHDWKDDSQVSWLEGAGIDLVRGWGVITGPKEVTVTAEDGTVTVLTAAHAVAVSTGSAALLPDVPGLRASEPWTSRDATSVQRVPVSLAILGGGVVGVEMATAYAGFGTEVHLISRGALLANDEPFAGEAVARSLRDLGATVHLDVSPTAVERIAGDRFRIALDDGSTIETDEFLVATGRLPRTSGIGLEQFGLKDGDWLRVDDSMRVVDESGEPAVEGGWLYGVGDVNHRALLTHQGKYQARAAGDAIAARAHGKPVPLEPWGAFVATADHQAVPQVTFTDPEVASVGLTAAAAEKAGYRVRVVDYAIGSVAGASVVADNYEGQARMIVDEDRQVVLGVTFVGRDVGELLHSATVAIVGEVPLARLWHAVPSYPTISEVWLRLLETYGRPAS
ncbi:NAD(P)/FAD-dependent oxidoreductase [Leifsonia sp. ZF2019]|uniref:dihydrolipoyl dehydrogenase family protein n=1 Tax=Leifsonia sp. ZF2019 TaxID=2781978 RepID=UPI001CBB0167|nr:NAD(P)/FAD-dependent oxidoreductase [Leifsonia sp. ZF2019]UAJ80803.1 NAD(P)/FAD-dependent oxidoreductase [Leifsonia sp. ZF2019]